MSGIPQRIITIEGELGRLRPITPGMCTTGSNGHTFIFYDNDGKPHAYCVTP